MQIKHKTLPVILSMGFLFAFALLFMSSDECWVVAPAFACITMMLWLWTKLWDRDGNVPFFDVGIFCAMATCLYSVYPLVNYWADGLQFDFLSDVRLQSYYIQPTELGFFHLRHVLYLFSFVAFYSLFRSSSKGGMETGNVNSPTQSIRRVIVFWFSMLTLFFVIFGISTADSNSGITATTYAEQISLASMTLELPLYMVQISRKLGGILFLFKLAVLCLVVAKCRQKAWRIGLLFWIGAEVAQTYIQRGSRTDLMLFLMAIPLLYHRMIKPLSMKFLLVSGMSLFMFFIFLGLNRTYIDYVSLEMDLGQTRGGVLSGNNEFQALLGTAYDVYQRKAAGAQLPWYLYINDFIAILPPQQVMPFEKVDAPEWYLREIGFSGTGQGYMWGVITQSIVGLDWIELILRGALLGYILAMVHRWYLKHQTGFMETLFYMFLCLKVYYTFRNTTFSLLTNFVWEVIPAYLLMRFGILVQGHFKKNAGFPVTRTI